MSDVVDCFIPPDRGFSILNSCLERLPYFKKIFWSQTQAVLYIWLRPATPRHSAWPYGDQCAQATYNVVYSHLSYLYCLVKKQQPTTTSYSCSRAEYEKIWKIWGAIFIVHPFVVPLALATSTSTSTTTSSYYYYYALQYSSCCRRSTTITVLHQQYSRGAQTGWTFLDRIIVIE